MRTAAHIHTTSCGICEENVIPTGLRMDPEQKLCAQPVALLEVVGHDTSCDEAQTINTLVNAHLSNATFAGIVGAGCSAARGLDACLAELDAGLHTGLDGVDLRVRLRLELS